MPLAAAAAAADGADDAAAELVDMRFESAFTPDPLATATAAAAEAEADTPMTDEVGRPRFAPAKAVPLAFRREQRKVPIPPHRMTPLKGAWPKIYVRRRACAPPPMGGPLTPGSPPLSNTSSCRFA